MFYCYCRCCWTPPTNFSERRIAMRSAQRVGHHDQFLEKTKNKNCNNRVDYHIIFSSFVFDYLWPVIHFTVVRAECASVCVRWCVCVRVWEVVVHDVTAKKLACKTSWPFVSVANNNRANHLNDITRK